MKKNILIIGLLGIVVILLLCGASTYQDGGRFRLVFGNVTREYYTFKAKYPKNTEQVQHCFKIDTETGQVWIFKDEQQQEANEQVTIRQYFVEVPVEKTVTTRMLP